MHNSNGYWKGRRLSVYCNFDTPFPTGSSQPFARCVHISTTTTRNHDRDTVFVILFFADCYASLAAAYSRHYRGFDGFTLPCSYGLQQVLDSQRHRVSCIRHDHCHHDSDHALFIFEHALRQGTCGGGSNGLGLGTPPTRAADVKRGRPHSKLLMETRRRNSTANTIHDKIHTTTAGGYVVYILRNVEHSSEQCGTSSNRHPLNNGEKHYINSKNNSNTRWHPLGSSRG
jgi:hypothetical protein